MESKPVRKDESGDRKSEPALSERTKRDESGLRLVVRKLQLPVRPRGVLAE